MMARKNGFEAQADYFGNLMKADPTRITMKSLEEAAEFYVSKLLPQVPESLRTKEHMKDHLEVVIVDREVRVVFKDTAFIGDFQKMALLIKRHNDLPARLTKHSEKSLKL